MDHQKYDEDPTILKNRDGIPSFLLPTCPVLSLTPSAIPSLSSFALVDSDIDLDRPHLPPTYSHLVCETLNEHKDFGLLKLWQPLLNDTDSWKQQLQQQQHQEILDNYTSFNKDSKLHSNHLYSLAIHQHVSDTYINQSSLESFAMSKRTSGAEETLDSSNDPRSHNNFSPTSVSYLLYHLENFQKHQQEEQPQPQPSINSHKRSTQGQPEQKRKLVHLNRNLDPHKSNTTEIDTSGIIDPDLQHHNLNQHFKSPAFHLEPPSPTTLDSSSNSSNSNSNNNNANNSIDNDGNSYKISLTSIIGNNRNLNQGSKGRSRVQSYDHSYSHDDNPSHRRRRLTVDETERLIDQYNMNCKPNSRERRVIARRLELHERTVQVWFQNRRAKIKRDDSLAQVYYSQLQQEQEQHVKSQIDGNKKEQGQGKKELRRDQSLDRLKSHGSMNKPVKNDGEDHKISNMRSYSSDDDYEIQNISHSDCLFKKHRSDKSNYGNTATITNKSLLNSADIIHRGSGTETFIGYERSDPGLSDPWLVEVELNHLIKGLPNHGATGGNGGSSSSSKSHLGTSSAASSVSPCSTFATKSHHILAPAVPPKSRASGKRAIKTITAIATNEDDCIDDNQIIGLDCGTDYYSYGIAAMDSDFGLGLETILGLQSTSRMDTGAMSLEEEILAMDQEDSNCSTSSSSPSPISTSGQSMPSRSESEAIYSSSKPSRDRKRKGINLRDRGFGSAVARGSFSQAPAPQLSSLPPMRRPTYLLQHQDENPIPRHQMALTLVQKDK
ncbi:hypothetical protein BGZ49_004865 [Haplosporangium sp. Z 27]|nr:hypothetical protein BGZ49_004865 [Haplosporangium sp. Z 27]